MGSERVLPSPPRAAVPESPEICVHPCSHRLAHLQGRAGDQGLGTGTCPGLAAWGRARHVLKAALVTRMLLCKLGAPCAAPRGRGSSQPPEMGILKHHKNASPSAERKHLGVGMRWNWMAEEPQSSSVTDPLNCLLCSSQVT